MVDRARSVWRESGAVARDSVAESWWRSPATAFLLIGLVLGVRLALVSPPMRWADENTHFLHAYTLSEGRLKPEIRNDVVVVDVPRAVKKLMFVMATYHTRREPGMPSWDQVMATREIRVTEERTVTPLAAYTYGAVGYAPQAIGIAVARWFTDSALLLLYAARIASLLCWLLLAWLAVRTTPYLRVAFCILALAPMQVFLAGSCAVDGVTNGVALLWTANVLRLAADGRRASTASTWIALGVLALLLALTKLLYTPLILLLLLVPAEHLGGRRRLLGVSAGALAAGVLVVGAWLLLSRDEFARTLYARGDTATATNFGLLRESPLAVLSLIVSTTAIRMPGWLWQLTDTNWKGIAPPPWLFWVWFAALACAVVAEVRPASWPNLWQRLVALVTPVLVWVAIALGAFLFWTKGERETISGLQGRYLIPLLPSLLIAACPPSVALDGRVRSAATVVAFALAAWTLLHTIDRTLLLY